MLCRAPTPAWVGHAGRRHGRISTPLSSDWAVAKIEFLPPNCCCRVWFRGLDVAHSRESGGTKPNWLVHQYAVKMKRALCLTEMPFPCDSDTLTTTEPIRLLSCHGSLDRSSEGQNIDVSQRPSLLLRFTFPCFATNKYMSKSGFPVASLSLHLRKTRATVCGVFGERLREERDAPFQIACLIAHCTGKHSDARTIHGISPLKSLRPVCHTLWSLIGTTQCINGPRGSVVFIDEANWPQVEFRWPVLFSCMQTRGSS